MNKLIVTGLIALSALVGMAEPPKGEHRRPPRKPPESLAMRHRPDAARAMMRQGRVRQFGKLADGRMTKVWRLSGRGGLTLDVTDFGGRVVRVLAPDRYGNLADVTLGWNTPAEYEKYGFSAGTLIGRVGNRIANGTFRIDDQTYQLAINEDRAARHCNLHSGPKGWDKQIWSAKMLREGPVQGIVFTYESPDGEMGFPGKVTCSVTYRVLPNNVWTIDYEATTDKTTVINPTHHSYWNLAGEASGNVLAQELRLFADEYTQVDKGLIPTKNVPVKGTAFDFTELRPIGRFLAQMNADPDCEQMNGWYDHNFVLRGKNGELKPAATMRDPVSGRKLEIWTTEPGVQVYGAQNMSTNVPAKTAGRTLCQYAGVALETQHFPDSPNRPDFPSVVLKPGETFKSRTEYRFTAE